MKSERVDVIATTMSGSVKDWGKVTRIEPLFRESGMENVQLHVAESHLQAREQTTSALKQGSRIVISAGGSGTFNAVLEGCCESGVPLSEIRLGFLRKGSADLIGKVLEMPDEIEAAVDVFVHSIREKCSTPCDIILASDRSGESKPRHFVGYGGAEVFGRIPHYTENRFIKYYKGFLGQLFGDMGPFTVGMSLALCDKVFKRLWRRKRNWRISIDGKEVAERSYIALILVNGYLGPDLPYSSEPLGSGSFYLFGLRDLGLRRLPGQIRRARSGSILKEPERWGLESFTVSESLVLEPPSEKPFPVNTDGSTMMCRGAAEFRIVDQIRLIARG